MRIAAAAATTAAAATAAAATAATTAAAAGVSGELHNVAEHGVCRADGFVHSRV